MSKIFFCARDRVKCAADGWLPKIVVYACDMSANGRHQLRTW